LPLERVTASAPAIEKKRQAAERAIVSFNFIILLLDIHKLSWPVARSDS
jgi:hypothetical protein